MHSIHVTPGNPCKRISTVTWRRCSLEVQVLRVEQPLDQYFQKQTPNTPPDQSY